MRLVGLVRQECGVNHEEIVLFRHTKKDTEVVERCGATVDEWTSIQPVDPKYDYRQDGRTKVLVVIVDHCIHRVFRLGEVEAEGPRFSISNEPLQRSYHERNKKDQMAFRVALEPIPFSKECAPITGWRGREIRTMACSTGQLFWEIEV